MQNVHFTPSEIARLMGVNESTVKRWVDKGVLTAQKTPGGHRRITKDDIQNFIRTHKDVSKHSYILKRLGESVQDLDHEKYYSKLLERRYNEAHNILHQAYLSGASVIDIIEKIIVPTLVVIGDGWRKGILSIESEHRITFVIRQHLIGLNQFISTNNIKKPTKVLLACVPGDNHELVLHILSLALREYGCEVETLGINISITELTRAVESYKPNHIVLSKVYASTSISKEYVDGLTVIASKKKIRIHVGGSGWKKGEVALIQKKVPRVHISKNIRDFKKLSQT